MAFAYNIEALGGPQRKIALRCIMAYRTVSTVAALVVNGMTPVHLAALESRRRYIKKKQGEIFDEASERNSTVEKLVTQRREGGFIGNVKPWIARRFGYSDFHLTQMLTGHGCFRKYLERFKRSESPKFVDCVAEEDDSEYTVFTCDRWWRLRREVSVAIRMELEPDTIISRMLESRENWSIVKRYVTKILSTKQEEERATQRHRR